MLGFCLPEFTAGGFFSKKLKFERDDCGLLYWPPRLPLLAELSMLPCLALPYTPICFGLAYSSYLFNFLPAWVEIF